MAGLVAPGMCRVLRISKRGVWHYPCGKSVSTDVEIANAEEPPRHEVTKLLKAVKTQLGIATSHIKKENKNINYTYQQVAEFREAMYSYDWLPKKQLQWYKTEVQCLNKPARLAKVLQTLHSSLQNYSVTFQELQKFGNSIIYPEKVKRVRNKIIEGMAQHLNQVLCEVDSAMISLGIKRPEQVEDDLLFSKPDKWNSDPDHTSSLIQDWGVISLYRNFVIDWYLIMGKVNKNTGCKDNKRRRKPKQ
ncbi:hypothetical protein C0J52_25975 [Blattella germanica]|nr:hypothetical protein C0J52_25975 [Blattella germanica]